MGPARVPASPRPGDSRPRASSGRQPCAGRRARAGRPPKRPQDPAETRPASAGRPESRRLSADRAPAPGRTWSARSSRRCCRPTRLSARLRAFARSRLRSSSSSISASRSGSSRRAACASTATRRRDCAHRARIAAVFVGADHRSGLRSAMPPPAPPPPAPPARPPPPTAPAPPARARLDVAAAVDAGLGPAIASRRAGGAARWPPAAAASRSSPARRALAGRHPAWAACAFTSGGCPSTRASARSSPAAPRASTASWASARGAAVGARAAICRPPAAAPRSSWACASRSGCALGASRFAPVRGARTRSWFPSPPAIFALPRGVVGHTPHRSGSAPAPAPRWASLMTGRGDDVPWLWASARGLGARRPVAARGSTSDRICSGPALFEGDTSTNGRATPPAPRRRFRPATSSRSRRERVHHGGYAAKLTIDAAPTAPSESAALARAGGLPDRGLLQRLVLPARAA